MHTKVILSVVVLYACVLSGVTADSLSTACIHSTGQTCLCDDAAMMNSTVTSLMTSQAELETLLGNLVKQFNATRDLITATLAGLNQRDHVASTLASTEAMLNKSQIDFARTFSTLNDELTNLRQQLKESEQNFTVCKTKPKRNETVIDLPYVTRYCGFEGSSSFYHWYCNFTLPWTPARDDWNRGSGQQRRYTGPEEDHTFGSPQGHYLYIDPFESPAFVHTDYEENHPKNRTATVATMPLPPSEHYCLRFWYTMYGNNVNTMTVYTRNISQYSLKMTEVDHMTGEVDKYWHMFEAPLGYPETSTPFDVVIQANLNSYRRGGYISRAYSMVAIDDFYIYNTTCVSVPKCPPGAQQMTFGNQTSCYTFHVAPDTWYGAVATCKTEAPNGHLVSVNSREEGAYIARSLGSRGFTQAGDTWFTSGNDERVEGQFMWTDTGYPEPVTYTDWLPGQPDDVSNTEQCLALIGVGNGNGYKWNDVSCDAKASYICEIRM